MPRASPTIAEHAGGDVVLVRRGRGQGGGQGEQRGVRRRGRDREQLEPGRVDRSLLDFDLVGDRGCSAVVGRGEILRELIERPVRLLDLGERFAAALLVLRLERPLVDGRGGRE